jgi:hypothetical protein
MEMTPPQKALYAYMENQSEDRWCAGWLSDLHLALLGDEAYEWLVTAAGGWFDRREQFVPGTVKDLERMHGEFYGT